MKKLLILIAFLFLTACSETEEIDVESFEAGVSDAVSQMDTDFEIVSSEENDDGTYTIMLSDNAGFVIDGNKVSASHLSPYDKEEVIQLYTILIGNVDESLSLGDRNKVIDDLGLREDIDLTDYTEVIEKNDIQYTVSGTEDSIVLQAEIN